LAKQSGADLLHRWWEALAEVSWFTNVGTPVGNMPPGTKWRSVGTREEMIERVVSDEWSNQRLEWSNAMRQGIPHETILAWNDMVRSAKGRLLVLIDEPVRIALESSAIPRSVYDDVVWDLIGASMETELSQCMPNARYRGLFDVYAAGRIPCGWEDDGKGGVYLVY
jgi:hypothetical protein